MWFLWHPWTLLQIWNAIVSVSKRFNISKSHATSCWLLLKSSQCKYCTKEKTRNYTQYTALTALEWKDVYRELIYSKAPSDFRHKKRDWCWSRVCVCLVSNMQPVVLVCFFVLMLYRIEVFGCVCVRGPSPHSKRFLGWNPGLGLSVWSLHVLPVYAWVLTGFFGFLPPPKNIHVRLIGDSKLSLGMSVSAHGCLSLCGAVMDWRPVLGVPCLLSNNSWDRLQPPRDPKLAWAGIENGWMCKGMCQLIQRVQQWYTETDTGWEKQTSGGVKWIIVGARGGTSWLNHSRVGAYTHTLRLTLMWRNQQIQSLLGEVGPDRHHLFPQLSVHLVLVNTT